ncbi:MAG: DNA gyrase inhibitor YacG [Candidatus Acidiferrum sp.]
MKHICPICKRPTDSDRDADFPFCSERCRLLDLGAWASEKYVVSDPIFDEDEENIPEREHDLDRHIPHEDHDNDDDTIH